jgi:hypothetical protein
LLPATSDAYSVRVLGVPAVTDTLPERDGVRGDAILGELPVAVDFDWK